jgi:hypothetical protein
MDIVKGPVMTGFNHYSKSEYTSLPVLTGFEVLLENRGTFNVNSMLPFFLSSSLFCCCYFFDVPMFDVSICYHHFPVEDFCICSQ